MSASRPVDGDWYSFEGFKIVLPGYGAQIEIIPNALLYPSLGTDEGNWVAVVLRVVTEKLTAEYLFEDSISLFRKLYDDLRAFPIDKDAFEFPGIHFFGPGVWCSVEPIGIHGWQVRCRMIYEAGSSLPDQPPNALDVRFRLGDLGLEARQQTADFLRFAASLAHA